MRDSSIRFRIDKAEKFRIEEFSRRTGQPVSEILRRAAATAIRGEVPGEELRRICVDVRRSANSLLEVLNSAPINVVCLLEETATIRKVAEQVIQRQ